MNIVVDGPAKSDALLARAGAGGALVLADSAAELARAAAAGVRRVGLRVALDSFTGARTRFGIPPAEVGAAARAASGHGLAVEALSTHLVSTDFHPDTGRVLVSWPRAAGEHAVAAHLLATLADELADDGHPIATIDLGGGFPPTAATGEHARAVTSALYDRGFAGELLLEPGRALASDAVDLAFSVVAVKTLAGGERCLICDAGTELPAGRVDRPAAARGARHLRADRAGAGHRPAVPEHRRDPPACAAAGGEPGRRARGARGRRLPAVRVDTVRGGTAAGPAPPGRPLDRARRRARRRLATSR